MYFKCKNSRIQDKYVNNCNIYVIIHFAVSISCLRYVFPVRMSTKILRFPLVWAVQAGKSSSGSCRQVTLYITLFLLNQNQFCIWRRWSFLSENRYVYVQLLKLIIRNQSYIIISTIKTILKYRLVQIILLSTVHRKPMDNNFQYDYAL